MAIEEYEGINKMINCLRHKCKGGWVNHKFVIYVKSMHKPEWYKRYRKQPVTLFRKAWVWSESEEKLYAKLCIGSVLHLCSGYSLLGDVKLDINFKVSPDVVADIHYLPFKNFSFDTIICDPPWYGPKNWMKWKIMTEEMIRIARKRIILILGNLFYPIPKPFELSEVYILKKISPQIKLIYVWNRHEDYLKFKYQKQKED